MGATFAYAVAALVAHAYAVVFMTLSSFTRWALAIGLVYVLLWEGMLADLLPGSTFSVRQATLGIAARAPPPRRSTSSKRSSCSASSSSAASR